MAAGLLAFAAPASAQVEPVGTVTFTATDGIVKVGDGGDDGTGIALPLSCDPDPGILPEFPGIDVEDLVEDDCVPATPPVLDGTVDEDGNLSFDPFILLEGDPIDVGGELGLPGVFLTINVEAPNGASGVISPAAGEIEIDLSTTPLVVEIQVTSALIGNHACYLDLELDMVGDYDQLTGEAVAADNQFTVELPGPPDPPTPGVPAGPGQCDTLIASLAGDLVGDLSTSGVNVVRLVFDVDPILTEELEPFAPTVGDLEATVPLGDSVQRVIPVSWHPAGECELDGPDGGATIGTATLSGLTITYTSNGVDSGADSVAYTCTNDEGSDSGTLSIEVLGNLCTAGQPDEPAGGCSLDQFIEFEIEGAELSMSQDDANVELGTIVLNGSPQVTTGELNTVTIVNRRGDGQEWEVVGQVSDFKTGGHTDDCPSDDPSSWDFRCVPGDNLGWFPNAAVAHQQVPGDVAAVTAGSDIDPADIGAGDYLGTGLGSSAHRLCHAAATVSGGTFACGAGLALVVPASASSGTYAATLTLTLS